MPLSSMLSGFVGGFSLPLSSCLVAGGSSTERVLSSLFLSFLSLRERVESPFA